MKTAELYIKKDSKTIICQACPFSCRLSNRDSGICGVRTNSNGEMNLEVWGRPNAIAVDPIEKKPLFHFLPSAKVYSIGTIGCNFSCDFCQNWRLSQNKTPKSSRTAEMYPDDLVNQALMENCEVIAFTYNEPTIVIEYAKDTFQLSKEKNLKNIFVTNGYISDRAIDYIVPFLDGVNIDLKSFSNNFYKKHCNGSLEPVLNSIKKYFEAGIWIEITTLLIPGENDSTDELYKMAEFISSISIDIPWHISAFHPAYKFTDCKPTTIKSVKKAIRIGHEYNLNYSYGGNVSDTDITNTKCHSCGEIVIKREYYSTENLLNNGGTCPYCSAYIPGIWR